MAGRPAPATALILTVYGAYVRRLGGWLPVAALVNLLDDIGQPPAAVRSATSRLKKAGLLAGEARHGVAGYTLTNDAVAILRDGDERIFASGRPADLSDGWVVAVFSVPERQRDRRHQLRSRLGALGFGPLGAGVWIAPRRVLGDARRLLERLDLARYVTLFAGEHAGFDDTAALVARTWDLPALAHAYERFERQHHRTLERWRRRPNGSGAEAFADYTMALSAWRRLPYRDPGLPPSLLPAGWPGERARGVFSELTALLDDSAFAHVRATAGEKVQV